MEDLRELLQPGRVIEFEDGTRAFIFLFKNVKYLMYVNGYDDCSNITANLCFNGVDEIKVINKIYESQRFGNGLQDLLTVDASHLSGDLIWSRCVTVTVKEIAEKFNIPENRLKIVL